MTSSSSRSTFQEAWFGGRGRGVACTVGVVDWQLKRARQEDAVRQWAGLAGSWRRPRLPVPRDREVSVRLPGRRQLGLT